MNCAYLKCSSQHISHPLLYLGRKFAYSVHIQFAIVLPFSINPHLSLFGIQILHRRIIFPMTETSSTTAPLNNDDKPLIVRVKRKSYHSPLEAFCNFTSIFHKPYLTHNVNLLLLSFFIFSYVFM